MTIEEKASVYAEEAFEKILSEETPWNEVRDSYAQAYIAGATEAIASQWVSVEDRLPSGTLVILCQSRMGEDNAIALCVYIKNRFMIYDRTFKYDKEFYPTHWLPIPELPTKGGEE